MDAPNKFLYLMFFHMKNIKKTFINKYQDEIIDISILNGIEHFSVPFV